MKLSDVLDGVSYRLVMGQTDCKIADLTNDSRTAQQGSLFIAIKGYQVDAHDLLEEVIKKDCRVLVVENEHKVDPNWHKIYEGLTVVAVESTLKAMAKISSNFYRNPSEKFTVVGITGTNGKTSIAQLLGNCLEANQHITAVLGTTGNRIGNINYPTTNTTVESIRLQWLFQEMVNYPVDTCIMEVSSHALKLHRVDETHFNYAIFTNLTEDHMDFHKDMEDYYQAKKLLFLKTEGACLINIDDPYGKRLYRELLPVKTGIFSYSLLEKADYEAAEINAFHDGSGFLFKFREKEMSVHIPIPGKIYVYNVVAVLALLDQMGLEPPELRRAVDAIRPVKGRLEIVPNNLDATVVVDYAHTPDALEKVIQVCREFTKGQLVVIFGCGGDRDKGKRPHMGQIASELADKVIVTSDNPRTEDAFAIIEEILKGIQDEHLSKVSVIEDRKAAIQSGTRLIHGGDTLIIAGKGHETYQIIGKTRHHFDDREEAANALLYRMGPLEE